MWLVLEWGAICQMGVSFLGTLLLPSWGLEPSTGAFTVISLNSVQGVDGAGLLTVSQRSLVAPWGWGSWLCRVCHLWGAQG